MLIKNTSVSRNLEKRAIEEMDLGDEIRILIDDIEKLADDLIEQHNNSTNLLSRKKIKSIISNLQETVKAILQINN